MGRLSCCFKPRASDGKNTKSEEETLLDGAGRASEEERTISGLATLAGASEAAANSSAADSEVASTKLLAVAGALQDVEAWEWARTSKEFGLGFAVAAQEIAAQLPWVGVVFTASLMLCRHCEVVHACKQSCGQLARLAVEVCKILKRADPTVLEMAHDTAAALSESLLHATDLVKGYAEQGWIKRFANPQVKEFDDAYKAIERGMQMMQFDVQVVLHEIGTLKVDMESIGKKTGGMVHMLARRDVSENVNVVMSIMQRSRMEAQQPGKRTAEAVDCEAPDEVAAIGVESEGVRDSDMLKKGAAMVGQAGGGKKPQEKFRKVYIEMMRKDHPLNFVQEELPAFRVMKKMSIRVSVSLQMSHIHAQNMVWIGQIRESICQYMEEIYPAKSAELEDECCESKVLSLFDGCNACGPEYDDTQIRIVTNPIQMQVTYGGGDCPTSAVLDIDIPKETLSGGLFKISLGILLKYNLIGEEGQNMEVPIQSDHFLYFRVHDQGSWNASLLNVVDSITDKAGKIIDTVVHSSVEGKMLMLAAGVWISPAMALSAVAAAALAQQHASAKRDAVEKSKIHSMSSIPTKVQSA
ncbi:hypothetical protein CYMTET_6960 [Cymbomonas tetramitiformis]|uniref:Uncharacterized protein n=1 Tax=Cymbomonas tetramitiformis TaxID=36881 RepID=A0AAE0LHD0_9CHLO|nr:hypothetical protein CYMTET_6960 [Cymbomonas tetramitiformis]